MSTRFLHTADWQWGNLFAGVEDVQKRSLLQQERVNVLGRLGEAAWAHQAEFIVVAGDLFDSPSATKATVSAACSALGKLAIPVFAIPGNHDHGGPGNLWGQTFFQHECAQLSPNLQVPESYKRNGSFARRLVSIKWTRCYEQSTPHPDSGRPASRRRTGHVRTAQSGL